MRKARRILLLVLSIVTGIYFVAAMLLWLSQAKYIYHPTRPIEATPAEAGLEYEDVSFTASDGVHLTGWFVPAEHPRGVILLMHGNGGNIGHRIELLAILNRLNFSTFIIDYRGYGASGGTLSEHGTYLDAEAAWDYLIDQRSIAPKDIVLMGRSLGGVFAAYLAKDHAAGAVIIDSSLTSVPDLGEELFPHFPVRRLSRYIYPTLDYLTGARCPVLIVHSPTDETVPFAHGQRLFEAAPEPKAFLQLIGAHNDAFLVSGDDYTEGVSRFLSQHLGR